LFRNHFRKNKLDTETIAEAARLAMKFEKLLYNIFPLTSYCLILINCTYITSASSERSFSKLKVIKTVMRSVMNQDRLKDFMTLGSEKDLNDSIDLNVMVDIAG
jgi:hypothetical protein